MPHRRLTTLIAAATLIGGTALTTTPVASAAADRTPPTTPGDLRVTGTTDGTVSLAWTPSRDNAGGQIQYRLISNGGFVGRVLGPTHTEHGLTRNTSYSFRIQAEDASGNLSGMSNTVQAQTAAGDSQAPTAPPNLRVTGVTYDSISLAWDAATDNSGRVEYYPVFVDGRWTNSSSGTSVTLNGLAQGSRYAIEVFAFDAAENWSTPSPVAATTVADMESPTTPTNLRPVAGGPTTAGLMWNASTDNRGVNAYRLFANGVWIFTTGLGTDFFTLTDIYCVLRHQQTYTFSVQAVDSSGRVSGHSNALTVTVP